MKSDTSNSATASAPTSANAAGKRNSKPSDRALDPTIADESLTDDEYLRRQSAYAKRAISRTASVMKTGAVSSAKKIDPLKVVRKHPWKAVGATAVAGFLGALWLNPGRTRWIRRRLDKLEKQIKEQSHQAAGNGQGEANQTTEKVAGVSLFSSLGVMAAREGWKFLQPMVMEKLSTLAADFAPKTNDQRPPDDQPAGEPAAAASHTN